MKIEFETSNAAFADGAEREEISNILAEITNKIRRGERQGWIWDSNGNRIGAWSLPGKPEARDVPLHAHG